MPNVIRNGALAWQPAATDVDVDVVAPAKATIPAKKPSTPKVPKATIPAKKPSTPKVAKPK